MPRSEAGDKTSRSEAGDKTEGSRRCAFLTLETPAGYVIDDELAYAPLQDLGWSVESIPWSRTGVSWNSFDAVVIRSPWDYQDDPQAFLNVLEEIESSGTVLLNGLDLVRWNLRKTYLRELAERGVPVVPTVWRDRLATGELAELFAEVGCEEAVVKPILSANSDGAFRLNRHTDARQIREVETYFANRALMAQPFVRAVIDEGEFSLFYFDGDFSHAILKTPKLHDFRVQEEHGGHIRSIVADDALRSMSDHVIHSLDAQPLYARVDIVRMNEGETFWLMELELIEPALYFRMDPRAPLRFATALDHRVTMLRNAAPCTTPGPS